MTPPGPGSTDTKHLCSHRLYVTVTTLLSVTTRETWHSTLPGMALLLAGASTVCLCESESRRASPATSVRVERLVCNTHTGNWRVYTEKAVQLAREQKLKDAEKYMSIALSEAIRGFGTDDPHTAEARQNLADCYWKMQKYDLAVPLYKEVVNSLTSMYGPQDARTATALHNLAGLYMAQKDVLAASKTMIRAIEARPLKYSNDGHLVCGPDYPWPALAKSVRGLAAIYRESGHSIKDVAEFLEKDLRFLTKEGEGLAPGVVVMMHIKPREDEEQQKGAGVLNDAEAICRALISNLKNRKDHKADMGLYELSGLCQTLARIVRAQGRLDEARQLYVEADNHYLVYLGEQAAKSNSDLPVMELLIEIELEDGSQDSLRRALDYQQRNCRREQAWLDEIIDTIESGTLTLGPVVWYRPGTYMPTRRMEEKYKLKRIEAYKGIVAYTVIKLTEAQRRLAEVQSRLHENQDAWATLTQALALLQSPVMAQALEWEEAEDPPTAKHFRERAGERKQEIQRQMSALYEAICSPREDGNAEQCVNLQQQLTAALLLEWACTKYVGTLCSGAQTQ